MIITVKTLQQQTFTVEIEATELVKALKQRIEDVKGKDAFPVEGQKLIYAGKMLDDAKPLSEYNIEEKNFIVAMVSKIKPAAAPVATPAATPAATAPMETATAVDPPSQATSAEETKPKEEAAPAQEHQTTMETSETEATPAPATTASTESSDTTTDFASAAASTLLTGPQYEENVNKIVDMGFSRVDVIAALRASFNNPDRAVEYLTGGMPSTANAPQPAAGETAVSTPAATEEPPAAEAPASAADNPFEFLRNQPQFQQMCQVLRENPSYLSSFMQELRETNPQLLAQITRNQAAFIELVNESASEQPTAPAGAGGTTAPPGTQYIQVSTEDKAAIDRLKALGFSEAEVLQVYIACNKNETIAANLLLDQD